MSSINIKNLSISSLIRTKATRITSNLLESSEDKKTKKTEQSLITQKISKLFRDFILKKYDQKYHEIISKHWPTIFKQALFNAEVSESDLLVCHCARKVFKSLESVIFHIENEGFYPFKNVNSTNECKIKGILKFLLHPVPFNRSLLSVENLKALFWRKDPCLMGRIREELKGILKGIHCEFSSSFLSDIFKLPRFPFFQKKEFSNDFLVDSLVEQVLCLYSYVEPLDGEELEIPVRVSGKLKSGKYLVEKIMLAPKWLGGPIEAFALNPKSKGFPPLLIFRGTPPNPTADGAFFASLTDYTPGFSVGETLYKIGKKQLHAWMLKTRKKFPNQKVKVIGQSLGGSLTYHFAKDFPASTEISAYDPAGLFPRHLSSSLKGKTFLHPNDIVSMLNYHPTSLDMIKVIPDVSRNFYYAHMKPYGFEPTLFLRVNPTAENNRLTRKVMLVFHTIYSIPFFIYKALYLLMMITANKVFTSIDLSFFEKYKHRFAKP